MSRVYLGWWGTCPTFVVVTRKSQYTFHFSRRAVEQLHWPRPERPRYIVTPSRQYLPLDLQTNIDELLIIFRDEVSCRLRVRHPVTMCTLELNRSSPLMRQSSRAIVPHDAGESKLEEFACPHV